MRPLPIAGHTVFQRKFDLVTWNRLLKVVRELLPISIGPFLILSLSFVQITVLFLEHRGDKLLFLVLVVLCRARRS
jgi:hypothetical protein